ncbi:MAG: hypothetical protein V3V00_07380 [Saprospiraceae bacterium]
MINFIIRSILVLVSFIVFFEFLSFSKQKNILLPPSSKVIITEAIDTTIRRAFLIGDSYAETAYLQKGFPKIFNAYFKNKGNFYFQNLSNSATELDTHMRHFKSLEDIHPEVIIYFYNINDIISLDDKLFGGEKASENRINADGSKKVVQQQSFFKNILSKIRSKSTSVVLLRDVSHAVFMWFTDRPTPGSTIYKLPQSHITYQDELEQIFNSFSNITDRLIIVVNTPMHYGVNTKSWKHYKLLKSFSMPYHVSVINAVDVIGDKKYAVSWRNGHYNQDGVNVLAKNILEYLH